MLMLNLGKKTTIEAVRGHTGRDCIGLLRASLDSSEADVNR